MSSEISGVIRALREADLRLEELTAGEVDTVADREGRSYLLQRAQDQWRGTESAKQAAILNALPARIILLDMQGSIVSMNETWQRLNCGNVLQGPAYGIGHDYLETCDKARGGDSADAYRAAAGIRSVLTGEETSFSMEYASHLPAERRWFLMTVTPLADYPSGVIVMHVDITDQKHAEEGLQRLAAAMDATSDAIYLIDRSSMRFIHVNEAACRMQGHTRARLLALTPAQIFATTEEELAQIYDALIRNGVDAKPVEVLRRDSDGPRAWLEFRRHAERNGDHWTIVTLVRNITERKEAETRIMHLNRVHAMLSGINSLIVRVRSRDELFSESCRIAVDQGGFPMVWIGLADRTSMKIVPVASIGMSEDFLVLVRDKISLRQGVPFGNTLAARSIREKKTMVANDLETQVDVLGQARLIESGIRSMAIFPLLIADEAVGMVGLYAADSEFFHDGEMKLLTELTSDIAFAMDHIEKQERLDYIAYYDVLTGLANRSLFLERTAQYIRSAVISRRRLALFLIDLERFKNINDSLGRPAGDALLRQVAEWLTHTVGDANLLARVGTDHFGVVLPDVKRVGDVARLLEKTLHSFLGHPFTLNDAVFRVSAKVGVALFPDDGADADTLYKNAESALKKAKSSGERYLCYAQKMTASVASRLSLENQLRQALEQDEYVLYYQPKVNLLSGELTGAEALLRWNDPRTGLVPPVKFIPILEETGLIHEVGRWALDQAIADYRRWCASGLRAVRVAVNVSPLQLRNRGFVTEVE
jgi:diguanylate cyclase (GGDEF)-like protein/PAS domain S-box-containing protein